MALICHASILSRHLTLFSHLYFGLHLPLSLTALFSHHSLFLPTSINFSLFLMASNNNRLVVKYCECRHNYAVRSMGHALDGCSEFCPIGTPDTLKALICAAFHCHRSFHKRVEVELENGVEISHPIDGISWNHLDPSYTLLFFKRTHHSLVDLISFFIDQKYKKKKTKKVKMVLVINNFLFLGGELMNCKILIFNLKKINYFDLIMFLSYLKWYNCVLMMNSYSSCHPWHSTAAILSET